MTLLAFAPILSLIVAGASSTLAAPQPAWEAAYRAYGRVLQRYVTDDHMVRYADLKRDPRDLMLFLDTFARYDKASFEQWSRPDRIALWLNVYNARTLQVIIEHYPIRASFLRGFLYPRNSIRQIPGAWDKWKFPVFGERLSLNDIEHQILRKKYREPRIHFALVCAAHGCPPLRREPYVGPDLDEQLDDQARAFLRSAHGFRFDPERRRVYLSSIFKWFGRDFLGYVPEDPAFAYLNRVERAVMSFVVRYLDPETRSALRNGRVQVKYLKYDWTLNEARP